MKRIIAIAVTLAGTLGCGAPSKSNPASLTPQSFVGTWTGTVNWAQVAGDNPEAVSITIQPYKTAPTPYGGGFYYTSSLTGTSSGGACEAGNEVLQLEGDALSTSTEYTQPPLPPTSCPVVGVSVTVSAASSNCSEVIGPYPTQSVSFNINWNSPNTITVDETNPTGSGQPATVGTLTKQ